MNMKSLGSILTRVGGAVLKQVIPGAGIVTEIIGVVNDLLPEDKKLPENATGTQIQDAIDGLPPDKQAEIMSKQFDVEMAEIQGWSDVITALSKAEESGASTRPKIALVLTWNLVFMSDAMIAAVLWAIFSGDVKMATQIKEFWPLVVAFTGPFLALLRAYFGLRSRDKQVRAHVATGGQPPGGMLSQLVGAIKGTG